MYHYISKFVSKFNVSRAKTLLKRRKKHIKSRTISDKKKQQQSKHINYAHEYKALQIRKQLDRKRYASQHVNELMEDIFYPDVTMANQQAAKLYMENSLLRDHTQGENQQLEMGQNASKDEYQQELNNRILATDLMKYYLENSQNLEIRHIILVCNKLIKYFKRRERIKQNTLQKWSRMNQNMKKKDKNYKQKRCPYIFIDREDTFHYLDWNSMVDDFIVKIQHQYELIQSQASNQSNQHKKIELVSIFGTIIQLIDRSVYYIPLKIFEQYIKLVSKITIQTNPDKSKQNQQIQQNFEEYLNIIKTANLKNKVRYPSHMSLGTNPILRTEQQGKSVQVIYRMIWRLLSEQRQNIRSDQLYEIIKILKFNSLDLSQPQQFNLSSEIHQKIKPAILMNLSDMQFQKSVDILDMYLKKPNYHAQGQYYAHTIDLQLIQLIKFDILRKCPNAASKRHLMKCMGFVYERHIKLSNNRIKQNQVRSINNQIEQSKSQLVKQKQTNPASTEGNAGTETKIYAYDLLLESSKVLSSQYAGKNLLRYEEVLKIINYYYINSLNDSNIIQLIANELVKLKQQLSLTELTQAVFKIYLLGYRSYVLSRILFQQQKKRYNEVRKRLQSEQVLLLDTIHKQVNNKSKQSFSQYQKTSPAQIEIQQNLVISLWLLFQTHIEANNSRASNSRNSILPVPTEDLMKVYPTKVISRYPLIYQMCINLNQYTNTNKVLWKIKCLPPVTTNKTDQLSVNAKGEPNRGKYNDKQGDVFTNIETDNIQINQNHRLSKFYKNSWYQKQARQAILKVMKIQGRQSQKFINNYHVQEEMFIPEQWSNTRIYSLDNYVKYIKQEHSTNKFNYFNKNKQVSADVVNLRKECVRILEQSQIKQKLNKGQKSRTKTINKDNKEQDKFYQID